MATLIDSASTFGFSWLLKASGYIALAQSFTATGGILNSVIFKLGKNGSPTGNLVSKIYAHSGVYGTSSIPTGAALAISGTMDASTVVSFTDYTFTFSGVNKIALTNGTYYCVTLEYDGGDDSNNILGCWGSSTTSGNFSAFNSTIWNPFLGQNDLVYSIYKDDPTPGIGSLLLNRLPFA